MAALGERVFFFKKDESGAVTADVVVMMSATVGIGLAVMGSVSGGVEDSSNDVSAQISSLSSIVEANSGSSWFETLDEITGESDDVADASEEDSAEDGSSEEEEDGSSGSGEASSGSGKASSSSGKSSQAFLENDSFDYLAAGQLDDLGYA